jgi:PIN domain nuclease of toxin-antitoxin system
MENQRIVYLDTHAAVWLLDGDVDWLTKAGRRIFDSAEVRISPVVLLELQFLHELGRLKKPAKYVITKLESTLGAGLCGTPLAVIIDHALAETWTRDPFDRLIVGHARANRSFLLTADEMILRHYSKALC